MADNTFLTGTRAIEKQIIFGDTRNEVSNLSKKTKFQPKNQKKKLTFLEKIIISAKLKIQASLPKKDQR